MVERGQDRAVSVERGDHVDQGNPHFDRGPVRLARDRHETREPLHDGIIARALAIRPGLPEARDRAVDEAPVHRAKGLVSQTEVVHRSRLEVLDEDVTPADEVDDERPPARVLQIDGDAPLAAVDREEVGSLAVGRAGRGPVPAVVAPSRVLDLDHLGAVVAQDLGGERTGDDAREVDDADPAEKRGHARHYTRPTGGLQRAMCDPRRIPRLGSRGSTRVAPGPAGSYTAAGDPHEGPMTGR